LSSLIGTVFLVGITEEALFRGLFLNALLKKTKAIYALTVSSLMFVIIHLPGWMNNSRFSDPLSALRDCASIFALGLVFGWTFMKSRNIFIPVFLHMLWNLLMILIVVRA
jgi:membrane protease YdiL (CAAX protease family)